jgi:hypothetical protein
MKVRYTSIDCSENSVSVYTDGRGWVSCGSEWGTCTDDEDHRNAVREEGSEEDSREFDAALWLDQECARFRDDPNAGTEVHELAALHPLAQRFARAWGWFSTATR